MYTIMYTVSKENSIITHKNWQERENAYKEVILCKLYKIYLLCIVNSFTVLTCAAELLAT